MLSRLISNVAKLTKDSKQSYFGKKWGADTGFNKQVDRAGYYFDTVDNATPGGMLNKQIIAHYERKPISSELSFFVSRLRSKTLSIVAERRGMQLAQIEKLARMNSSAAAILGAMYECLDLCASELNCALAMSELQVVSSPPQSVTEVLAYSKSRQPIKTITYFRTRFLTPTWAIAIRTKDDVIEAFLLPTHLVMGLSKTESQYTPEAVIRASWDNNELEWQLDGGRFDLRRAQQVSMALFQRLIERTRNELAPSPKPAEQPWDPGKVVHPFLAQQFLQSSEASSSRADGRRS